MVWIEPVQNSSPVTHTATKCQCSPKTWRYTFGPKKKVPPVKAAPSLSDGVEIRSRALLRAQPTNSLDSERQSQQQAGEVGGRFGDRRNIPKLNVVHFNPSASIPNPNAGNPQRIGRSEKCILTGCAGEGCASGCAIF